jgi:hypothetical protein
VSAPDSGDLADDLADIRFALELPDADARFGATAAVIRARCQAHADEMTLGRIKRLVTAGGAMGAREFERIRREAAAALDGAEGAPQPGPLLRVTGGLWCYGLGGASPRGVYQWADRWELRAGLPYVHARIVRRGGDGVRSGTSGLLSADEAGPRMVLDTAKIRDGSWAAELGMPLSADRKIADAVATAIDALIYDPQTPECESVPGVASSGRVAVPVRECLPGGYLRPSTAARAAALADWAAICRTLAEVPAGAAVVAASAAAWIVRPLGLQAHWYELWGDAGQGKTTAERAAGGVYGDPSKYGGVCLSWDSSPVGLGRYLGKLGILPAFFDERGMAKFTAEDWARQVMSTCEGGERLTGSRTPDETRRSAPWGSILFSTGNGRMLANLAVGRFAGISRRLISIEAPFTASAEAAELITGNAALETPGLIDGCYGHLGAELLERYTVADARRMFREAGAVLPSQPAVQPARSIDEHMRVALAGATMCDEVLGLPGVMLAAVAEFALDYLERNSHALAHDADRALDAVRQSLARDPMRWPTVAEYRANMMPWDGIARRLPQHGIAGRDLAGVRADDGAWVAVFPPVWSAEMCSGNVDESSALSELYRREVVRVAPSLRKKGEWPTPVRIIATPAPQVPMIKLVLPLLEDDEADAAPNVIPSTRELVSGSPQSPPSLQVSRPNHDPNHDPNQTPITPPITPGGAGIRRDDWPAQVSAYLAEVRATPWLRGKYHPTPEGALKLIAHHGATEAEAIRAAYAAALEHQADAPEAAPPPDAPMPGGDDEPTGREVATVALGEQGRAALSATEAASPAAPARQSPAPLAAAQARPRGPAFAVLSLDGRAYGPDGAEFLLPPGWLAEIRHVGDLAALALEMGARVLYVPREVREALRLPASVPVLPHLEGYPHQFTEAADPAAWDVWPSQPVGLAGWLTVYRMPSTLREGCAVAFPEWLPEVGDGPQLGGLAPAALAEALTLIWQATTYQGKDGLYGGAHYARSPGATMRRLLGAASRRRRSGPLEPLAELPPVYHRKPGGALARVPSLHMAPALEIPAGYVVAELDVRSCFLSAAIGTDFGIGEAQHRRAPKAAEVLRMPGAHLVRADGNAAAIHPALWPVLPAPVRGRAEVSAWVDTIAAVWLRDRGVPFTVAESWVWPELHGRRVLASVADRLGAATAELGARPDDAAQAAAAIVKAMYARTFGGMLASDFGGQRDPDDPWHRPDWWLTVRVQAEVRKQRNLWPGLEAGTIRVLGESDIDAVFVAAESREVLEAMPGTGGRPAISDGRGKFRIKDGRSALVTPGLSALLRSNARPAARRQAIREALAEAGQ